MKFTYRHGLVLLFVLVVGVRLYVAFQAEHLLPEAYFTVQQVSTITEAPELTRNLSFATIRFSPLFYYLLALGSIFGGLAFKVLPHLLLGSLVFIVYYLSRELTGSEEASFVSALTVGFIPVLFSKTLYTVSVYSFVLPLTFFLVYAFFRIDSPMYVYLFIIFLGALRFTHPSVVLLIAALLLYLIFVKVENVPTNLAEIELILFSTLLIVWSLFINFKNALLTFGPTIIWQNIPASVLSNFFRDITIFDAVTLIGVIPFVTGVYIVYKFAFKEKERKAYLLISFCLLMALLLFFKLIALQVGLMFLGVAFTVLMAKFYTLFTHYIGKSKAARFRPLFVSVLLVAVASTTVVPALVLALAEKDATVSSAEVAALTWLRDREGAAVVATLEEGFMVTALARRNPVIDEHFIVIPDAIQRLEDVDTIYTTLLTTEAIRLMNKYGARYLYFSERAQDRYGIPELAYVGDPCFTLVYDAGPEIYELSCVLEER